MLPRLFDMKGRYKENCYLFAHCIFNYAMNMAFINGICLILSLVAFGLICNFFKVSMGFFKKINPKKKLMGAGQPKSILRV